MGKIFQATWNQFKYSQKDKKYNWVLAQMSAYIIAPVLQETNAKGGSTKITYF